MYEGSTPGERKNGDLVLTPAASEGSQLQIAAKDNWAEGKIQTKRPGLLLCPGAQQWWWAAILEKTILEAVSGLGQTGMETAVWRTVQEA